MRRQILLIVVLSFVLSCVGCNRDNWQDVPPTPQMPPQMPPQVMPPQMMPPQMMPPQGGGPGQNGPSRTIKASGYAMVPLAPDEARMLVVAMTRAADVDTAKAENAAKLKTILGIAKASGLAAADIHTGRSTIGGIHAGIPNDPVLEGVKVVDEVQLTFKDLDKIEPVLVKLLSAKAVTTWDISYRNTKAKEHRKLLLEEAVKRARAKATAMAAVMDHVPGVPVSIAELWNVGSSLPPAAAPAGGAAAPPGLAGQGTLNIATVPRSGATGVGTEFGEAAIPGPGMMAFEARVEVVFLLIDKRAPADNPPPRNRINEDEPDKM